MSTSVPSRSKKTALKSRWGKRFSAADGGLGRQNRLTLRSLLLGGLSSRASADARAVARRRELREGRWDRDHQASLGWMRKREDPPVSMPRGRTHSERRGISL